MYANNIYNGSNYRDASVSTYTDMLLLFLICCGVLFIIINDV